VVELTGHGWRVRSVQTTDRRTCEKGHGPARPVPRRIGASGHAPRSSARRADAIGRGGASGHVQPDASGQEWTVTGLRSDAAGASGHVRSDTSGLDGSLLDRDWALTLSHPVKR
jgi:hypothetical protein